MAGNEGVLDYFSLRPINTIIRDDFLISHLVINIGLPFLSCDSVSLHPRPTGQWKDNRLPDAPQLPRMNPCFPRGAVEPSNWENSTKSLNIYKVWALRISLAEEGGSLVPTIPSRLPTDSYSGPALLNCLQFLAYIVSTAWLSILFLFPPWDITLGLPSGSSIICNCITWLWTSVSHFPLDGLAPLSWCCACPLPCRWLAWWVKKRRPASIITSHLWDGQCCF